jgi:hypothetical protein
MEMDGRQAARPLWAKEENWQPLQKALEKKFALFSKKSPSTVSCL